jgi:hypothetical protein
MCIASLNDIDCRQNKAATSPRDVAHKDLQLGMEDKHQSALRLIEVALDRNDSRRSRIVYANVLL